MGGFLFGAFDSGDMTGVENYTYDVQTNAQGDVVPVACGQDNCEAIFDPMAGWFVGGQLFFGYAISSRFDFGVRAFGAYRFKGGFLITGGPSISGNVTGPLWLGLTPLVGVVGQDANVTSVSGKVKDEYVAFNGGNATIPVRLPPGSQAHDDVNSGIAFGASIEIALQLADTSSGGVMVATWPMFLKGTNGYAIAIPVGLGYRFY